MIFSPRSLIHLIQNSSLSSDGSDGGARAGEGGAFVGRLAAAEEKADAMGATTDEAEEKADAVGVHGGWYAGRRRRPPVLSGLLRGILLNLRCSCRDLDGKLEAGRVLLQHKLM